MKGLRRTRPTLAVHVVTRDSETRLAGVLAQAHAFADEVLVGVDMGSIDATYDAARANADLVYRFAHSGEPSPARMLVFDRTQCDWILQLDDDEGVDAAFPEVLPELLADDRYTHWRLNRKWIVQRDPCMFLKAPPWYPDPQVRLFRNRRELVWKSVGVHTGLNVMGSGGWESRTSLLHYEPIEFDDAARIAKLEHYKSRGGTSDHEQWFMDTDWALRAPVDPAPLAAHKRRRRKAKLEEEVIDVDSHRRKPPWDAEIEVEMPGKARPGEVMYVSARARNTGGLAWVPRNGGNAWPRLDLSYRLRDSAGHLTDHQGECAPMPTFTDPGGAAHFMFSVVAPAVPGEYLLDWQLVSQGECWFTDCGAEPARTRLRVG